MNYKLKDLSTLSIWVKGAENHHAEPAISQNILSTTDGVTSMKTTNDRGDHREILEKKTTEEVVAGRIYHEKNTRD